MLVNLIKCKLKFQTTNIQKSYHTPHKKKLESKSSVKGAHVRKISN